MPYDDNESIYLPMEVDYEYENEEEYSDNESNFLHMDVDDDISSEDLQDQESLVYNYEYFECFNEELDYDTDSYDDIYNGY